MARNEVSMQETEEYYFIRADLIKPFDIIADLDRQPVVVWSVKPSILENHIYIYVVDSSFNNWMRHYKSDIEIRMRRGNYSDLYDNRIKAMHKSLDEEINNGPGRSN
jgi:hypothetical protein